MQHEDGKHRHAVKTDKWVYTWQPRTSPSFCLPCGWMAEN